MQPPEGNMNHQKKTCMNSEVVNRRLCVDHLLFLFVGAAENAPFKAYSSDVNCWSIDCIRDDVLLTNVEEIHSDTGGALQRSV
jgi:hypothetical protein